MPSQPFYKNATRVLTLLGLIPLCGSAQTPQNPERIPVEPTPWRAQDHFIDGWDWSLPPGIKAVPYSGTSMNWPTVNGRRYDLPGNEIIAVKSTWRELEPVEGQYRFELLRDKIVAAHQGWDGVELHLRATVWDLTIFPDHPNAQYPANWLEQARRDNVSAPQWLEKYDIPKLLGHPRLDIRTPFQITNCDIFSEAYHRRYLKFIEAFGRSGIPQMKEVKYAYLHLMSGSRGEENLEDPIDAVSRQRLNERLDAWAEAFKGVTTKLAIVSALGPEVPYAYQLGIGQRNGWVDQVMQDAHNPQLGQIVDKDGYMTVDESLPPIKEGRAFGDENEEFGPASVPRFGPLETFAHRYRESMLRVLQMRRNFVWIESTMINPPLTAYVSLELGRNVTNTPDIWCYLRESVVTGEQGQPLTVKNFERWLYQRDGAGHIAAATEKVAVPPQMVYYHRDHKYDYTARKTDRAAGNDAIGFAVDDRFLSGGPQKVALKITYRDRGPARWALIYNGGRARREVSCWGSGEVRTVTYFLDDATFDAQGLDYDFEIKSLEGDVSISFVRVIKL